MEQLLDTYPSVLQETTTMPQLDSIIDNIKKAYANIEVYTITNDDCKNV